MSVIHGDCLEVMATLDAESIDAIVTDPPYALLSTGARRGSRRVDSPDSPAGRRSGGFMGKAWDGTGVAFRPETWAAALRVAKPGAYLLAFGGTRTVHRMTVALEDAGWIIRDMLVWAYACLSDDTEVLTSEGWVRYNNASDGQLAAAFDTATGAIRWEPIEAVHRYDHEGPMAVVGPSLVTLNHRVVLEPDAAAVPRLSGMWNDVHEARRMVAEGASAGVLQGVQRQAATAGPALSNRSALGMDRGIVGVLPGEDDRPGQSRLEGRGYRVQEARELLGRPVHPGAGMGATDGPQGRLRDGASLTYRRGVRLPADADGVREPREPRPDGQPAREPDALAGQPDAQALRMGQVSGGDGEPDEVRLVDGYRGVVWCITVGTGAFVARRNGVVFVTGNSGFPKGRANLKPAWEPIVMARKPGPLRMLAIDECRIPAPEGLTPGGTTKMGGTFGNGKAVTNPDGHPAGRWPANVVLTETPDGGGIFDGGWDGVVGGGETAPGTFGLRARAGDTWGAGIPTSEAVTTVDKIGGYDDSGTYSRFFLVPKSSRSDREPVLDEYAYRLHRERGECDKLGAWDSAGRSRSERTASTSPARDTSGAPPNPEAADSSSGTSSPGSPSTVPSPTATRSTTGTATSRTTPSPTSPSLTLSPTSASTPGVSSETANGGSPAESAASSSLCEPPTGISVPRAGRSMDDADPATFGSSSSRSVCGRCGKPLPRVGSHPTVKPTDLMRHLVRLVTPPGGTVLDPFLGSGTTALAAEMEGFAWIGIEKEAEYVEIAEARLNGTQKGMAL